ncbi:MAG: hypothetical protein FWG99_03810 [Treponema sp.]|nr:hypothetical protein [Treponema sp.]
MKLSMLLPLFFIFFINNNAFSQEYGEELPYTNSIYIINSFSFNIKGITRQSALVYKGDLKTGEEITGLENLERYIRNKQQVLMNERVLEKVNITYTAGEIRPDGKIPVVIYIESEDTWNIIAVPYPKYSSNTGFELILKGRDYNFLGTMNPLRLDIGYKYDADGRNSFIMELDSNTPFRFFGFNWNFIFDNIFEYRPDVEEHYYFKNTTGLSMELPVKQTTLTFGFTESVILNAENSDRDVDKFGEFQSGIYMSSNPFVSWKIPTGVEVGDFGILTYTPEVSAVFNHDFSQWPLADNRKGPFLSWGHSLGFDRIDWIENFRRGFDVSVDNSYRFDFFRFSHETEALSSDYSFTAVGHFVFNNSFGISSRVKFRHWFYYEPPYNDQAADVMRGILNRAVRADYMLSLNLDIPVKVLNFLPSLWLNQPKLHIFDFELHISPILDLAIYHDPVNNVPFDITNTIFCGGLEFIFFPAVMRSLYLRASFAMNFVDHINPPPKVSGESSREIFIGIGHHY